MIVGSAISRHIADAATHPLAQVLCEIDDYVVDLLAALG
jgi:hypothetical protein